MHFTIPVREYMSSPVRTLRASAPIEEADQVLHEHDLSAVGVVSPEGRLVGVLSRTDLLKSATYGHGRALTLPKATVADLMTPDPISVGVGVELRTAARTMRDARVHRVFVEDGDRLVGVLSTRDLMRTVVERGLSTPLGELAHGSLVSVKVDDPLALAADRLDRANKHGLVVVEDGWPVGIFDQRTALASRGLPPETRVDEVMSLRIATLPAHVPISRAAAQALALKVRRILVVQDRGTTGIVSGLDFARFVAH
ncbi:MAG: CBS domain-containing protein [Sandaracinus sp.]|nr:CBS domain-containing protein [Myxococcales bacterium]MCB9599329.1 CBS domain-containing protein [Sandaracinus sp.]MCB9613915.1 CBS domain-containing protein [Sandaracinus sp.]MCB9634151.1 CBS domain-containing protein [Sandaracinus sp.]